MAKHPGKDASRQLLEVAEAQQGFFTASQACAVGFSQQAQSYHVKMGNWVRERRGIYRLAFYPMGERPDLMLWFLWAHNREGRPEGVFSHETALSIHSLSDLIPARLHMTVPPTFRRSAAPEEIALHRGVVADEDVEYVHGVAVTRPMRTLLDLLTGGTVYRDVLRQALAEALKRGLITKSDLVAAATPAVDSNLLRNLYALLVEVCV